MIVCPVCNGTKIAYVLVHHAPDTGKENGFQEYPCDTCDGSGTVADDYAERLAERKAEGNRMRLDRLARGVHLDEEAQRLGISIPELSARERGK